MNDLSDYRIKNAKSRLDASKMLLEEGFYKDSINRSYYAIFDSKTDSRNTLSIKFLQ